MDVLTFISKIIDAIAWPGAVLIALLALRKPIANLLPFVQKLKYKEFEIEFGKRVEEVTAEVVKELTPGGISATSAVDQGAIYRLAEVSPRSAVLEAWRSVELAALETGATLFGADFRNKTMTYQALRALEKSDNIDRNVLGLIRELRSLRNEAAHAPDFALSKESAIEYSNAAQAVVRALKSIPPQRQ